MDDGGDGVEVVRAGERRVRLRAVERRVDRDGAAGGARGALLLAEPQVDGHRDGAEPQAPVERDGERRARRQRDAHTVARAGAARVQPARRGVRRLEQRGVGQGAPVGHEGGRIAVALGGAREPGLDLHASLVCPPMSVDWTPGGEYGDIRYELSDDGIAKITIDRPEVRNAFRPKTIVEISDALEKAREDPSVGVIVLTGEGPLAFCSGGDQNVRGDTGYVAEGASVGRFHVTDLHVQIRRLPKPVVAMVAGYAVGGGQVLHMVCDLTIAADNARFGQTGPRVGSWDGGFGASLMRDLVGTKKAKEMWLLCRQYDAEQALEMGLVNTVVPLDRLEEETVAWCREMLALSPFALRLVKASFHAHEDGYAGIQQLAHDANLLFYASDEAKEGREAYKARRPPDFSRFPRRA